MKDVSIILVSYNTKDLTVNAIKSIYEQTKNLDFEIFLVDNNSQDDTCKEVGNSFPDVNIIINKENLGFGVANNIAIEKSDAKYVFLLNTDTLLLNNAIKILFDFMEKEENQNIAVCGGNLYNKDNLPTFSHGVFLTPFAKFLKTFGLKYLFKKELQKLKADYTNKNEELKKVEFICGADLFLRKSVLDKLGSFDPIFFLYYEETELQHRIRKAGYEIYIVPDAKIAHLESASSKNKLRKKNIFLKSEYIYLKKCFCKNIFSVCFLKMIYLLSMLPLLLKNPKEGIGTYLYIAFH